MKVLSEHYNHIKTAMAGLDYETVLKHKESLIKTGDYKDLNTRMVYDCARAAGLVSFTCEVLYKYVDDSHIKTALLKAGKELNFI
jgi:hypothetical protein